MDASNNKRRRTIYPHAERKRFADLIRQFGARGAREVLCRRVCLGTLLKIAAEFGIELKQGRRPASALSQNTGQAKIAA
jgi:hypothetical protein